MSIFYAIQRKSQIGNKGIKLFSDYHYAIMIAIMTNKTLSPKINKYTSSINRNGFFFSDDYRLVAYKTTQKFNPPSYVESIGTPYISKPDSRIPKTNDEYIYDSILMFKDSNITNINIKYYIFTDVSNLDMIKVYNIDFYKSLVNLMILLKSENDINNVMLKYKSKLISDVTDKYVNSFCFNNITGFDNQGTSCFMDSVLMALIAIKDSPFNKLINIPIKIPEGGFSSYRSKISNDVKEQAYRENIRNQLVNDRDDVIRGKSFKCSNLRLLLNSSIIGGEESLMGISDPSEFISILYDIFNYNPMKILDTTYWYDPSKELIGSNAKILKYEKLPLNAVRYVSSESQSVSYDKQFVFPLTLSDAPIKSLQQQGFNGIPYLQRTVIIDTADYITIHVDRSTYIKQLIPYIDNNGIQSTYETVVADDSNPSTKPVSIPDTIIDRNNKYVMRSVVYLPNAGHYQALLKCGDSWSLYNDSQIGRGPISSLLISDDRALEIITTKAVLLFYFKSQ